MLKVGHALSGQYIPRPHTLKSGEIEYLMLKQSRESGGKPRDK